MILNSPYISGSITVTGNATIQGTISGSVSGTASNATTASFAATASSADNLLVRNTLTAQTLVVQTITSSVDFVTGSTRFGSIISNTHVFTGSMSVSGSGTFAGALSGTSATFSGTLGIGTATSPAAELQVGKASDVTIALSNSNSVTSGNRGGISWFNSSVSTVANIRAVAVTDNVGTGLEFYTRPVGGSLTKTFDIASTGAATFSSSVTALGGIINGSDFRYAPSGNVLTNPVLVLKDSGNSALDIASEIIGDANVNSRPIAFRVSNPDMGRFEAMRITSTGNVGIGTSSPFNSILYTVLDLYGSSVGGHFLVRSPNVTAEYLANDFLGEAYIGTRTNSNLVFRTNLTERMRITSGGNVGIGVPSFASTNERVVIRGANNASSSWALVVQNLSGSDLLRIRNDGLVSFPQINNFTTGNAANTWINPASSYGIYINTSSARYKKDIIDYDKGIDIVTQLRPVYYKGISEVDGDKQFAGLIAEEVHDLGLVEFVNYLEDGRPNSLSYPNMLALAFKSIQELKVQNDDLQSQINELKA